MLPGDWRSTINAARVCWMRYASRPGSPIGNDHRNVPTSCDAPASHQKEALATSARRDRIEDGAATRESRRLAASRRPERK